MEPREVRRAVVAAQTKFTVVRKPDDLWYVVEWPRLPDHYEGIRPGELLLGRKPPLEHGPFVSEDWAIDCAYDLVTGKTR